MSYQIELLNKPAQPVLSVRTHAAVQDLPTVLGKTYGAIMQYLAELGEQPAGMPFVGYYDMNMQNLDIEIGFPVAHPLEGRGDIQCREFPGGELASVMHIGPYEAMEAAYNEMYKWVDSHGYQLAGACYELYYSEPGTPPQEIRTQIIFPVKPK